MTWPGSLTIIATGLLTAAMLMGCGREVERSGVTGDPSRFDAATVDLDLGVVTDTPAIEQLTIGGLVVVEATQDLRADALARVVELPLVPGDAVEAGDVVAILRPTTPEIETFDAASRALASATEASSGPRAGRPSAETMRRLLADRDAAAAALAVASAPASEPVTLVAESGGVVVEVLRPLGGLVDVGDGVVTVGPVSSVEVHVVVDDSIAELLASSAQEALLVERSRDATPQPLTLAPLPQRIVSRGEAGTTLRLSFDLPPRVTEGLRADVVVSIEPDPETRSVPIDALRMFNGQAFVLVVEDDRVRRVDVEVSRLGTDRAEVIGAVALGDRVLRR